MQRPSKHVLTSKDQAVAQQPLKRDGYSNDNFDKLYPGANPFSGTPRDRKSRRFRTFISNNPLAKK